MIVKLLSKTVNNNFRYVTVLIVLKNINDFFCFCTGIFDFCFM